jgi:hypothetical protein
MMKPLDKGYQKIDMCLNFYMLYYLENIKLIECRTCGHTRYKHRNGRGMTIIAHRKIRYISITPKLQMLFISPKTTEHIT